MAPLPLPPRRTVSRLVRLFPLLVASAPAWLGAQPVNNPVTTAFPGEYAWTDVFPWSRVTTTAAVPGDGADDLAVVHAEIASIAASGGGVLYFPPGDYHFSGHLRLKAGVVIRGATPAVADARDAAYDPPTNFWFPRFTWGGLSADYSNVAAKLELTRRIVVDDPVVASRYGIVDIDIQRAIIDFVARWYVDPTTGATDPYERFAQMFGTDLKNRLEGDHVVVFGNRVNNALALDPTAPNRTTTTFNGATVVRQNAWQVWPNQTHAKIDVHVRDWVMIANNRLMDIHWQHWVNDVANRDRWPVDDFELPFQGADTASSYLGNGRMPREANSMYATNAPATVLFEYAQAYGILANRSSRVGFSRMNVPITEPSIYRRGVTVRRNWVYNTTRVAIQASGSGLEVIDNVKTDRTNKLMLVAAAGTGPNTNNAATYENRGIDLAGDRVVCTGNVLDVRKGYFPSGFGTVDGEGILYQDNNAGLTRGTRISGNRLNAAISIWKMRWIEDLEISGNQLTARGDEWADIHLDADEGTKEDGFPNPIYRVNIRDNDLGGGGKIKVFTNMVGRDIVITGNTRAAAIDVPNLGSFNALVYTITGNNVQPNYAGLARTPDGIVPAQNAVDLPPVVEILQPTPLTPLLPGAVHEVRVRVTPDPEGAGVPLQWVRFYDSSDLTPNFRSEFDAYATGSPRVTSFIELADPDADGVFTGTWTVPATIRFGMITAEARLQAVTIKNSYRFPYTGQDHNHVARGYAYFVPLLSAPAEVVPPGFAAWREGFAGLPASGRGLRDDPDGDGVPNLLEYAFGLDPTARGASALPALVRAGEGAAREVRYAVTKAANDLVYRPQMAATPEGTWQPAGLIEGVVVEETSAGILVKVPESSPAAFLRVEVEPAP